jgi:hypothetical protein
MRELGRVVHGAWGSDISIAMVVPRSGTKPCGRQGLVQVSQRERAQMEPCNPKICTRWAIWRRARQRWLTLLVGFGKRRFEKGFPGGTYQEPCVGAECVERRHQPMHEINVFTKSPRVTA